MHRPDRESSRDARFLRACGQVVAAALLPLSAAAAVWGAGGCGGNESSPAALDRSQDGPGSVLDSSPEAAFDATSRMDATSAEAGAPDGTTTDGRTAMQCPAPTMDAAPPSNPPPPACVTFAVGSDRIATFAGSSSWAFGMWGVGPVAGGTFAYPTCVSYPPEPAAPLFQDFTASNWHITGNVGTYSGFGLWWEVATGDAGPVQAYSMGVLDASAFAGIQFDISGDAGPLGVLTLNVQSAEQQATTTAAGLATCGACEPDAGPCTGSTASVPSITSTPRTVSLYWSDFMNKGGGATFDPAKIVAIDWSVPWVQGATPYAIDVTLANIQFMAAGAGGD